MGAQQIVSYIATCDLCGRRADDDEYATYGSTPEEAVEFMTGNAADDGGGWTIAPDGRLACDMRTDAAHEDVHATAGKRMGYQAMSVSFAGS